MLFSQRKTMPRPRCTYRTHAELAYQDLMLARQIPGQGDGDVIVDSETCTYCRVLGMTIMITTSTRV